MEIRWDELHDLNMLQIHRKIDETELTIWF